MSLFLRHLIIFSHRAIMRTRGSGREIPMPRMSFETKLTNRISRAELSNGVYWQHINSVVHLGYSKRPHGGRWIVRCYLGNKRYRQRSLGIADDIARDGSISFQAARQLALEISAKAHGSIDAGPHHSPGTVRSAAERYIKMRDSRHSARAGRTIRSDAASRLGLYVLRDPIADVHLTSLTEHDLVSWKHRLNANLMPSSRWRTQSDFKAALNATHLIYRHYLPDRFADTIKYGLSRDDFVAQAYRHSSYRHILNDDTIRDIIKAASSYDDSGDVWRMVLVLAATGARFSQVQRLQVQDLQYTRCRLMMPSSRKGRNRIEGYYPVQIGSDVIAALRLEADGRDADAPLLRRSRRARSSGNTQQPEHRVGWASASQLTRPWKTICASVPIVGVVPYSLRHSSIVRCIRKGLPLRLVAKATRTWQLSRIEL